MFADRLMLAGFLVIASMATDGQTIGPPASIAADGVPPIPGAIAAATRPYLEYRTAQFAGWDPHSHGALILTRFGNTNQVHLVESPGAARQQLSFEEDPISSAGITRGAGSFVYVAKDTDGNEVFQLFRLEHGKLSLLSDPKDRVNDAIASGDGRWLGYSSPGRDGSDDDLYVMDPQHPESRRMVAQVKGNWWMIKDFDAAGRRTLVAQFVSIGDEPLFELDLQSGQMTPRGTSHQGPARYASAKYGPGDVIFALSDADSDFSRLGRVDRETGRFEALNPETGHDVEDFAIAPDGSFVVYTINDDGVSHLRILDLKTKEVREPKLPLGRIGEGFGEVNLIIAPWGEIGFTLASARSPDDVYSVNPKTLAVTRWTQSETGGLDPQVNAEPQLVKIKSFDGTLVSGFLYLPDPKRFPGRRPLILSIHGGPEYQARPGFLGSDNYLINELGIGMFYPNVRGSTGYGKQFTAMDNGPFKREDSVQDIGAFIGTLGQNLAVDPARIAVSGTSYGGYMTLATMVHYSDRLRAGLERVGISNFVTFLEHTGEYRRDLRRPEYGDERVPEQRAKLLNISPLTHAGNIRIPLLAEAGGNDPRVPAAEAEAIVSAVRAAGGRAWLLIGRNEGHHFLRKENSNYQFWAEILFWRTNLLDEGAGSGATQVGQ